MRMGIAKPQPFHGSLMDDADLIIGWVYNETSDNHNINSSFFISDYWSFAAGIVEQDSLLGGQDNIVPICGKRNNRVDKNVTTIRFQRQFNTGDDFDHRLYAQGPIDIIYAWSEDGSPGHVSFHGDNRNHVQIDFSTKDGYPATDFGRDESGLSARLLVNQADTGHLITIQSEKAGSLNVHNWPYGSIVDMADSAKHIPGAPFPSGAPFLLLSGLERSIINWKTEPKCSLSIQLPVSPPNDTTDAMMYPRVTLMGTLVPVSSSALSDVSAFYMTRHPMAQYWVDFADFHFYQFNISDIFTVGGFGDKHYIGWIDSESYLNHDIAD